MATDSEVNLMNNNPLVRFQWNPTTRFELGHGFVVSRIR